MPVKLRTNLDAYRRAKRRVQRGLLGVYPALDRKGNLVVYLMHKRLNKMKLLLSIAGFPISYIRNHHKWDYGYFHVKLMGDGAEKWLVFMKKSNKWRTL